MKRWWVLPMLCVFLASSALAGQEVTLRHNLTGWSQDVLEQLVQHFNETQPDRSRIVLQDLASLEDGQKKRLPHMALLDPDDSMAFFQARPRFRPLHQVMAAAGEPLDAKRFFPLVADAVDDRSGRLLALPLGLSLPVLMWNRDAYRKAGLDPDRVPKTWEEVQEIAGHLADAGVQCPLTSSRFAWVHLENLSSQHGEPLAVQDRGGRSRAVLNRLVGVKHLALLSSWYKSAYFRYYGPGSEGDGKFLSGECAMLTGESSLYARALRAGFDVGVAETPHYADMHGVTPDKVLPDGAALWVLAGGRKEDDRVVARFAGYLQRPEVQAEWLRSTGYLPMTPVAVSTLRREGVELALLDAATRRLSDAVPPTPRTKHGSGLVRLREILGEEVAAVWANTKPAKEALDTAMRRINAVGMPGSAFLDTGESVARALP